MNPELYERYLQKKAKKLGITVEELKSKNSTAGSYSSSTVSSEQISQPPEQYTPLKPAAEKTEIPSYIFSPSSTTENSTELINNNIPEIKDNRENKFALIGYPLGHSLSEVIHTAGFKSLGINASYEILETPPDSLVERIKMLKSSGYKGFNVTIPLKLPVSLFVNEVDKYADLARAVNTVYIETDKTLKAYNTDVTGFKRAIPSDINLNGGKIAILGTGGAAHAALVALSECNVKEIAFFKYT